MDDDVDDVDDVDDFDDVDDVDDDVVVVVGARLDVVEIKFLKNVVASNCQVDKNDCFIFTYVIFPSWERLVQMKRASVIVVFGAS